MLSWRGGGGGGREGLKTKPTLSFESLGIVFSVKQTCESAVVSLILDHTTHYMYVEKNYKVN